MAGIRWLIFVLLLMAASLVRADSQPVMVEVYGDDAYPPYSYQENGVLKGIYTEILRVAFSRMKGYQVQMLPMPWKRGLQYLESGEGFALYPPYHHVTDRPYIWPYSLPILDEKVVVFCRDELMQQPRPRWPEDYYGLTIGNNAGFFLGGERFREAVDQGHITLAEKGGSKQNLLKLVSGRVDCYINDRLSILWELKALQRSGEYNPDRHHLLTEGATISLEQGFLGITARDFGRFYFKEDFLRKFDSVIYGMRKSGELQQMVDDFIAR